MILSKPNTVRSGYWKSRRSLLCLLCVLIILMSAGSTNADSDNNEDTNFSDDDDDDDNDRDDDSSDDDNDSDNDRDDDSSDGDNDSDNNRDDDSSDDDDDSDNDRDDGSSDDDDDSDNYRDDDSSDDDDDSDNDRDEESSDDDSYEIETSESTDYISYSDREEETDDKSNTDDNTAENQRGNHLVSTGSSGKNNNEKEIEQGVRNNDKKDDTNSDDIKSRSSVSTDQNENKDTKSGDDDEKPTDNVKNDKDREVDSDNRNDSSDNSNTDSDDSVKDNPANTASSSTNSPTRDSSTQITTNIPGTITTITTENSGDTGTTSNSANNDDSSTGFSSVGSSTDSSNTSQTSNPAINNDYESNVSVNVSPTVTEDANFLKDFRDSTEAPENVELKDYSFASLVKGQEAVFEFGLEGNNIVSISFIPEVSGGQVKTVVEVLKNTSTLINEAPPGVVYKNFNIWVGDAQFSPYMTNDAKVNFKVEKGWLLSNNIDHESVVLYGHVNGWNPLVTEKTGEDDTYVYYTAHTPVFSVFAIVSMDHEPYKLDEDQAVSTIGDTAAASGGMDEIPHYNTYRNVALLLVSLLVAGVMGMTGLKYMARPGNEDEQGENDSIQFKK